MHRIFLLSPARSDGRRAQMLFNPRATFALARSLHAGGTRPIGEIFSFLSGLYFRGKLAYAQAFGTAPKGYSRGWVITADRGLLPMEHPIGHAELRAFREVPIDLDEPRYRLPLEKTAAELARIPRCHFVLLGSISTDKYVGVLSAALGERLLFPADFVGRGDMSRGGLMLRSARAGNELPYRPVAGAVRRGVRPPRLAPLRRGASVRLPDRA